MQVLVDQAQLIFRLAPQGYSFASGAALSSDAFIVGGATHGTSVARLQSLHWDALPSCLTPRLHAAVAACGDHLFVLVSPLASLTPSDAVQRPFHTLSSKSLPCWRLHDGESPNLRPLTVT